jgi:hypothetical protein
MKIRVNALILAISIQKRPSVLMLKATVNSVKSVFIPFRRLMMKTVSRMPPSSMSRSFWSTRRSLKSIFPLMGGRPTTMRKILVLLFEFLMLMLMERISADPHPREGRMERMIVANLLRRL